MAKERDEENWEFRAFLKQYDMAPKEIDAIVHRITDEVTSQIDCTKCANCCKQIRPILDKDDVSKLALGLKIALPEFQEQYLSQDEENKSKHRFNELPCPFLKNDQCSHYDCRPDDCRSYPHLHKRGFVSRLWGVVANSVNHNFSVALSERSLRAKSLGPVREILRRQKSTGSSE